MNKIAWRWQWPRHGAELLVTEAVAQLLSAHHQRIWETERGGQLFVDPDDRRGLVLAGATSPHPADRAGWAWLELDSKRCRQEIAQANARGWRLVGYWHTHPQVMPKISPTDVASFAAFATRYAIALSSPLAVIVGKPVHPRGIRAWSIRDGQPKEGERATA